jgi:nucleoside-diphosphate-sugar epimerase
MNDSRLEAILLTGATGYLGSLAAAGLLEDRSVRLVCPVRSHHCPEKVLTHIAAEFPPGAEPSPNWTDRIRIVPLPPNAEVPGMAALLRLEGVREIVHCAGCVDYFNNDNLNSGNIELTTAFVTLGQELGLRRFTFISTAFSSGYRDGLIPESLHESLGEDPTDYTRTKRQAEEIVHQSGLPYLLVRPSVVIGDSRDGRYRGKRYGIYQLWAACEKIMCSNYVPEIFAIAPPSAMPLLHQDAFQAAFLAAFRTMHNGGIVNLVSRERLLPTVRQMWDLWLHVCNRPRVVHYYRTLADVPMERLSRQQQMWVELTGVNLEISTRPWRFARNALDQLERQGLEFRDVTLETITACQQRFIANSPRVRQFMQRFAAERSVTPQIVEHHGRAGRAVSSLV